MRISAPLVISSLLHVRYEPHLRPCNMVTQPTDDRATPWRLQQQKQAGGDAVRAKKVDVAAAPEEYQNVLRLLRDADQSGRWPPTSRAREKVLRVSDPLTSGSMSLRNMGLGDSHRGTRANLEFPELATAIFELENALRPNRPSSTMVAVNRRATFVPHTDAGAGFEESTSLIVGLGEYTGGELIVDGEPHDIRYIPLEFDGWRQQHSTAPFQGERFSLVWFTPANAKDGKPYGATLDPNYMSGKVRFNIPGFDIP